MVYFVGLWVHRDFNWVIIVFISIDRFISIPKLSKNRC